MTAWAIATILFFASFIATILGYIAGYHRGTQHGFSDGERYGELKGYRQAWLRQRRPLLNAETQDWYDQ